MKYTRTIARAGAALALGVMLGAGTAQAAHKVSISDGTTTFTIEDDMAGDSALGVPGVISFFVSFGGGQFTTGTASTSVASDGNKNNPVLTLGSLVIESGADTITVKHTDTGYLTPGNGTSALAVNSLTTPGGSVSYSTYWDGSDTEFGTASPIDNITLNAVSAAVSTGPGPTGGPYSLTEIVEVMLTSAGQSQFVTELAITAVPEPATLMLFGFGLAAAGAVSRRRLGRRSATPIE